jgi:cysteine desulfurase/selenocysteine lyase
MQASKIKSQFPIFINHPNLVYLDNASTTQTPQIVLDGMNNYYSESRANIHRTLYDLGNRATEQYENARKKIANFINAEPDEIIFTSGTTHGLNLLAYVLNFKKGDTIVLTRLEHHANLIPWQTVSKCTGAELRFIELTPEYELNLESAKKLIDQNTKLVSFSGLSNSLGTRAPIEELIKLAHQHNTLTIVDAAQLVAHEPIDVKKLDCDFLVFSGHKMYGPTGIGILYGKKEKLEKLEPFFFGGEMIKEVSYKDATWNDVPLKFEAGTPNIAGAIGLGTAVDFINELGYETIISHEQELVNYLFKKLPPYIKVIGPALSIPRLGGVGVGGHRSGIVSFTIEGVHPHDIAEILNRDQIAIRSGHHCTMPLMKHLGITGTARISLGVYTTKEDINKLIESLEKVKTIFNV